VHSHLAYDDAVEVDGDPVGAGAAEQDDGAAIGAGVKGQASPDGVPDASMTCGNVVFGCYTRALVAAVPALA
jgi:hypothetical protein